MTKFQLDNIEETNNNLKIEIEDIKKKIAVKPLKSKLREDKIKYIDTKFQIFKSDLEYFPDYIIEEKRFQNFRTYGRCCFIF